MVGWIAGADTITGVRAIEVLDSRGNRSRQRQQNHRAETLWNAATDQLAIDKLMLSLDGTKDKSRLGANAIVATSIACAKAAAASLGLKAHEYLGGRGRVVLPVPFCNVV